MKATRAWYKAFNIGICIFLGILLVTLIVPTEWANGITKLSEIVFKLAMICLIISALNAFESYINRKKTYFYRVYLKYIPKKPNADCIVMDYSVRRPSPIWDNRQVLCYMDMHDVLYPEFKEYLDNGTIEVTKVSYIGSKYKYKS
tara:strand:+ start:2417 stop:2851 length:435 start_codon:yes stop_codon:yes gene_type:complete